jgi:predicted NUDIX family phosphoesterase
MYVCIKKEGDVGVVSTKTFSPWMYAWLFVGHPSLYLHTERQNNENDKTTKLPIPYSLLKWL